MKKLIIFSLLLLLNSYVWGFPRPESIIVETPPESDETITENGYVNGTENENSVNTEKPNRNKTRTVKPSNTTVTTVTTTVTILVVENNLNKSKSIETVNTEKTRSKKIQNTGNTENGKPTKTIQINSTETNNDADNDDQIQPDSTVTYKTKKKSSKKQTSTTNTDTITLAESRMQKDGIVESAETDQEMQISKGLDKKRNQPSSASDTPAVSANQPEEQNDVKTSKTVKVKKKSSKKKNSPTNTETTKFSEQITETETVEKGQEMKESDTNKVKVFTLKDPKKAEPENSIGSAETSAGQPATTAGPKKSTKKSELGRSTSNGGGKQPGGKKQNASDIPDSDEVTKNPLKKATLTDSAENFESQKKSGNKLKTSDNGIGTETPVSNTNPVQTVATDTPQESLSKGQITLNKDNSGKIQKNANKFETVEGIESPSPEPSTVNTDKYSKVKKKSDKNEIINNEDDSSRVEPNQKVEKFENDKNSKVKEKVGKLNFTTKDQDTLTETDEPNISDIDQGQKVRKGSVKKGKKSNKSDSIPTSDNLSEESDNPKSSSNRKTKKKVTQNSVETRGLTDDVFSIVNIGESSKTSESSETSNQKEKNNPIIAVEKISMLINNESSENEAERKKSAKQKKTKDNLETKKLKNRNPDNKSELENSSEISNTVKSSTTKTKTKKPEKQNTENLVDDLQLEARLPGILLEDRNPDNDGKTNKSKKKSNKVKVSETFSTESENPAEEAKTNRKGQRSKSKSKSSTKEKIAISESVEKFESMQKSTKRKKSENAEGVDSSVRNTETNYTLKPLENLDKEQNTDKETRKQSSKQRKNVGKLDAVEDTEVIKEAYKDTINSNVDDSTIVPDNPIQDNTSKKDVGKNVTDRSDDNDTYKLIEISPLKPKNPDQDRELKKDSEKKRKKDRALDKMAMSDNLQDEQNKADTSKKPQDKNELPENPVGAAGTDLTPMTESSLEKGTLLKTAKTAQDQTSPKITPETVQLSDKLSQQPNKNKESKTSKARTDRDSKEQDNTATSDTDKVPTTATQDPNTDRTVEYNSLSVTANNILTITDKPDITVATENPIKKSELGRSFNKGGQKKTGGKKRKNSNIPDADTATENPFNKPTLSQGDENFEKNKKIGKKNGNAKKDSDKNRIRTNKVETTAKPESQPEEQNDIGNSIKLQEKHELPKTQFSATDTDTAATTENPLTKDSNVETAKTDKQRKRRKEKLNEKKTSETVLLSDKLSQQPNNNTESETPKTNGKKKDDNPKSDTDKVPTTTTQDPNTVQNVENTTPSATANNLLPNTGKPDKTEGTENPIQQSVFGSKNGGAKQKNSNILGSDTATENPFNKPNLSRMDENFGNNIKSGKKKGNARKKSDKNRNRTNTPETTAKPESLPEDQNDIDNSSKLQDKNKLSKNEIGVSGTNAPTSTETPLQIDENKQNEQNIRNMNVTQKINKTPETVAPSDKLSQELSIKNLSKTPKPETERETYDKKLESSAISDTDELPISPSQEINNIQPVQKNESFVTPDKPDTTGETENPIPASEFGRSFKKGAPNQTRGKKKKTLNIPDTGSATENPLNKPNLTQEDEKFGQNQKSTKKPKNRKKSNTVQVIENPVSNSDSKVPIDTDKQNIQNKTYIITITEVSQFINRTENVDKETIKKLSKKGKKSDTDNVIVLSTESSNNLALVTENSVQTVENKLTSKKKTSNNRNKSPTSDEMESTEIVAKLPNITERTKNNRVESNLFKVTISTDDKDTTTMSGITLENLNNSDIVQDGELMKDSNKERSKPFISDATKNLGNLSDQPNSVDSSNEGQNNNTLSKPQITDANLSTSTSPKISKPKDDSDEIPENDQEMNKPGQEQIKKYTIKLVAISDKLSREPNSDEASEDPKMMTAINNKQNDTKISNTEKPTEIPSNEQSNVQPVKNIGTSETANNKLSNADKPDSTAGTENSVPKSELGRSFKKSGKNKKNRKTPDTDSLNKLTPAEIDDPDNSQNTLNKTYTITITETFKRVNTTENLSKKASPIKDSDLNSDEVTENSLSQTSKVDTSANKNVSQQPGKKPDVIDTTSKNGEVKSNLIQSNENTDDNDMSDSPLQKPKNSDNKSGNQMMKESDKSDGDVSDNQNPADTFQKGKTSNRSSRKQINTATENMSEKPIDAGTQQGNQDNQPTTLNKTYTITITETIQRMNSTENADDMEARNKLGRGLNTAKQFDTSKVRDSSLAESNNANAFNSGNSSTKPSPEQIIKNDEDSTTVTENQIQTLDTGFPSTKVYVIKMTVNNRTPAYNSDKVAQTENGSNNSQVKQNFDNSQTNTDSNDNSTGNDIFLQKPSNSEPFNSKNATATVNSSQTTYNVETVESNDSTTDSVASDKKLSAEAKDSNQQMSQNTTYTITFTGSSSQLPNNTDPGEVRETRVILIQNGNKTKKFDTGQVTENQGQASILVDTSENGKVINESGTNLNMVTSIPSQNAGTLEMGEASKKVEEKTITTSVAFTTTVTVNPIQKNENLENVENVTTTKKPKKRKKKKQEIPA